MTAQNDFFGNRRGVAIARGHVIAAVTLVLVAVVYFWAIPAIKEKMLGDNYQVVVTTLMAYEANDIPYKGDTVARTVVNLEIKFPMGRAPGSMNELQVVGSNGDPVPVDWPPSIEAESGDIPDKGITRWVIKDAYFPIGFRQGRLRNQFGDLCVLTITDVVPAATTAQ